MELRSVDDRLLHELTSEQLRAVREIYEEAFPAWERDAFDDLVRLEPDPTRLQLAILDREDVVGLATLSRLRSVPWWFLEYFAVTAARRDQGLGGQLWDVVIDRLGDDPRPAIVMEVERPDDAPAGSVERTNRERRIRFYLRRGAQPLDVPVYRVPRLSGDGTGELLLLAVPAPGEAVPTGPTLEALVRALYLDGYGLPPDNDLLGSALASLRERRPAVGSDQGAIRSERRRR